MFLSYNSIKNHYDRKSLNYFFNKNPEYQSTQWICQHKYDGSNFQVIFAKETDEEGQTTIKIQFGTRNCLLEEHENFNNHKSVFEREVYKNVLKNIKSFLENSKEINKINLFGEIFGKVQKRIKYDNDNENKILFFDVVFNDIYQTPKFFIEWAKNLELPIVECFTIGTFDECLAFDLKNVKTALGDQIEGVVIKPYDIENFQPFYIKHKSEGFAEIEIKKTVPKQKEETSKKDKYKVLYQENPDLDEFESYLNSNRAKSAFSKKNWIKNEQAQLANEILEDALKDFKSDHEETNITFDMIKKIFLSDVFKIINQENFFS